jgi:hypothetical protein
MAASAQAVATAERPPRLVFVYTWDIIRAVLAIIGAMSAFAGGTQTGTKVVDLPVWEQVVGGVSSAAYAAALIIVSVLLSRHQSWVRSAQLILLLLSAVFIAISIVPAASLGPIAVAIGIAFLALDFAALWSLTRRDATAWYSVPGSIPKYMIGCLVLWTVGPWAALLCSSWSRPSPPSGSWGAARGVDRDALAAFLAE